MIKSIKNSIGAALLALCGFIGFTPEASACTSFLVGKKASADGSCLHHL